MSPLGRHGVHVDRAVRVRHAVRVVIHVRDWRSVSSSSSAAAAATARSRRQVEPVVARVELATSSAAKSRRLSSVSRFCCLKPISSGEPPRALAHEHDVVGVVHHRLRHGRRRGDVFERADRAGPLRGSVHARSRRAAPRRPRWAARPAPRLVVRVELHDVDAGHDRVERIGARAEHVPRHLDALLSLADPSSMPLAAEMITGRDAGAADGARRGPVDDRRDHRLGAGEAGQREPGRGRGTAPRKSRREIDTKLPPEMDVWLRNLTTFRGRIREGGPLAGGARATRFSHRVRVPCDDHATFRRACVANLFRDVQVVIGAGLQRCSLNRRSSCASRAGRNGGDRAMLVTGTTRPYGRIVPGNARRRPARTLALVAPLGEADLREQHDPLMSPILWDLATSRPSSNCGSRATSMATSGSWRCRGCTTRSSIPAPRGPRCRCPRSPACSP